MTFQNTPHLLKLFFVIVLYNVVTFATLSYGAICSEDHWCWENPLPHGNPMRALWGSNENDVFHVGLHGTIYHFDGSVWSPMKSGTVQDLYSVWGRGNDDVFVVGSNGTILHYDGKTWQQMDSGTTLPLLAIWGNDSNDMVAVGYGGTVLRFAEGSWSPMNAGTQDELGCVWGSSGSDIFVGSFSSGTILHYNGSEWTSMNTGLYQYDDVRSIWGSGSDNVYAVTGSGKIIRYNGTGLDWNEVQLPPSESSGSLTNIYGTHDDNIYVSGVVSYHFDGSEWTVDYETDRYAWGVTNTEIIFIAGQYSIKHFNGNEWKEYEYRNSTIHFGMNAVWTDGTNAAVAVGFGGGIAIRNGGVWEDHSDWSLTGSLNDVWGADSNNVFAVGDGGSIVHFNGNVWTAMESGFAGDYRGVWGSGASDVFAVGNNGRIDHYNGISWSLSSSGTENLNAVWGRSSTDVFAVGDNGAILHYDGNNWSEMNHQFQYNTMIDVWGTSSTDVYVLSMYGKVLHYDGNNWSDISSGEGFTYLRSIHGSSPSNVLVLEQSGVIRQYKGNGWKKLDTGITSQLMDIFVGPEGDSYLVGMGGEILYRHKSSPGDINRDGSVNLPDAILALQATSGRLSNKPDIESNVNTDNRIGLEEAVFVLQHITSDLSQGVAGELLFRSHQ